MCLQFVYKTVLDAARDDMQRARGKSPARVDEPPGPSEEPRVQQQSGGSGDQQNGEADAFAVIYDMFRENFITLWWLVICSWRSIVCWLFQLCLLTIWFFVVGRRHGVSFGAHMIGLAMTFVRAVWDTNIYQKLVLLGMYASSVLLPASKPKAPQRHDQAHDSSDWFGNFVKSYFTKVITCVVFYAVIFLLSKCMLFVLVVFDGEWSLTSNGLIRQEEVPGHVYGKQAHHVHKSWSEFWAQDVTRYADLMLSPLSDLLAAR